MKGTSYGYEALRHRCSWRTCFYTTTLDNFDSRQCRIVQLDLTYEDVGDPDPNPIGVGRSYEVTLQVVPSTPSRSNLSAFASIIVCFTPSARDQRFTINCIIRLKLHKSSLLLNSTYPVICLVVDGEQQNFI